MRLWKGHALLAVLIVAIALVTVYAARLIEPASGKPKDLSKTLAISIQNTYNRHMQDQGTTSRAVNIKCRPTSPGIYTCRALTLDPGGVKCVTLTVDAGPGSFTVKAASFDPVCPEGDKV